MDPPGLHVIRRPGAVATDQRDGSDGASALNVVVVHGGMDRASSFGRVARCLPEFPLVRYDRRGYGRSIDAGVVPIEGHVDDLLSIIGQDQVVLFGHSMGAVVALMAAERRPDLVRSVLAYETPLPWESWWPKPAGGVVEPRSVADDAERFMRRMVGDRIWDRLPAQSRADRRAEGEALRADLRSLGTDRPLFDPASLVMPILSAAGAGTTWWHLRASKELALSVLDGELVVVAGASHGAHLSHPGPTADLVRQAYGRVVSGPRSR